MNRDIIGYINNVTPLKPSRGAIQQIRISNSLQLINYLNIPIDFFRNNTNKYYDYLIFDIILPT